MDKKQRAANSIMLSLLGVPAKMPHAPFSRNYVGGNPLNFGPPRDMDHPDVMLTGFPARMVNNPRPLRGGGGW